MRYIRYSLSGETHLGAIDSKRDQKKIIPLEKVYPQLKGKTLIDFIAAVNGDPLAASSAVKAYTGDTVDAGAVKILAPIERPIHDVLCVGVNYAAHRAEAKRHLSEAVADTVKGTVYFAKRAYRILGDGEIVHARYDIDPDVDYESELAVIIGVGGKGITEEDAEKHVFGYSVFNDLSSRRLQKAHSQWLLGKGMDDYTAMGPCIVDRTELPFPLELDIKSYVNGELRQNSNTSLLIKTVPGIIAELSRGVTLDAGDIIATGTPSGVGMGFVPPKYLNPGDTVICEIQGIGKLTNTIEKA